MGYSITDDGEYIEHKLDGLWHRPNGPAVFNKNTSGWLWMLNGVYNRYYGPVNSHDLWYINGQRIK